MKVVLLLLLLALSRHSHADNVGVAYLAMQHKDFPCGAAIRAVEQARVPRVAFLYHTFGRSFHCPKLFASKPKNRSIQIYLLNEVGHRNNRLGKYEFLRPYSTRKFQQLLLRRDRTLLIRLKLYLKPVIAFAATLPPQTSCYITPGLESNLGPKAARILTSYVRPLFPSCTMVWNGGPRGARSVRDTLLETHGLVPPAQRQCIGNLDGTDIDLRLRRSSFSPRIEEPYLNNYLAAHKHCAAVYLWVLEFNGNCQKGTRFIDPRMRKCFPDKRLLDAVGTFLR